MKKGNTILPVYDLWPFNNDNSKLKREVYAAPFAPYLAAHPHFLVPHRHSFYHMVMFTKGSGVHVIDFEQFSIQKGQLYFMAPGQVHTWNFTTPPDGYVVNFSPGLFSTFLSDIHYLDQFRFFSGIGQESVLQPDIDTFIKAEEILSNVVKEVQNDSAGALDMIRSLLLSLFIILSRTTIKNTDKQVPQHNRLVLLNFRKLVEQYYTEMKLPKEYAAMLYITPNHLNALCNDVLGKPAGEIIRDRIVLQAKRLLVNADLQVAEIASQLNFPDNSYFTKFFRKYTGSTPENFRKQTLGSTLN
ncbi:MAG: helix-turn-helix transcriptional regulator [Flavipsychrobacter sp.]|nr:helix-turn-helix transcriptional regulator [Flavipsychrobacter sp.]